LLLLFYSVVVVVVLRLLSKLTGAKLKVKPWKSVKFAEDLTILAFI
jgi:hypothetical protein